MLNTHEAACFGFGPLLGTGSTQNIGDDPFEMENLQVVNLNNRPVYSITTGQQHTCAVVLDDQNKRRGVCWGQGNGGVLGYDNQNQILSPGSLTVLLPGNFQVAQISAYSSHTCALSTTGQVRCWGTNKFGKLGLLSLGSTAQPCFGCRSGQMEQLKGLSFGCVDISKTGSCPFLGGNPLCQLCRKSWPPSLCITYSFACRWVGKLNQCVPRQ